MPRPCSGKALSLKRLAPLSQNVTGTFGTLALNGGISCTYNIVSPGADTLVLKATLLSPG